MIVNNRVGAGGMLCIQTVAKADPDGYAVLFAGDDQLRLLPQRAQQECRI